MRMKWDAFSESKVHRINPRLEKWWLQWARLRVIQLSKGTLSYTGHDFITFVILYLLLFNSLFSFITFYLHFITHIFSVANKENSLQKETVVQIAK